MTIDKDKEEYNNQFKKFCLLFLGIYIDHDISFKFILKNPEETDYISLLDVYHNDILITKTYLFISPMKHYINLISSYEDDYPLIMDDIEQWILSEL